MKYKFSSAKTLQLLHTNFDLPLVALVARVRLVADVRHLHVVDEIDLLHKRGGTHRTRILALLQMDLGVLGETAAVLQSAIQKKTIH